MARIRLRRWHMLSVGVLCLASVAGNAADRVIGPNDFGHSVTVSLDETFIVGRPVDVASWQVDFATDILELLSPPETRQSPGPEGWRFRAIGIGETDLALTERPPKSGSGPPAPRRFVVTIRVKR